MRDVLDTLNAWTATGKRLALARVVETWGSAPRRPGAALLVSESGEVAGSVSGGCIEGAVITEALGVLESGARKLCTYGIDSETAWSVGLSCGGTVRVLLQSFEADAPTERAWLSALNAGQAIVVRTPLSGPEEVLLEGDGQTSFDGATFTHRIDRPARLLIIGGADIAVHLTAMATRTGFLVTVVDPRAVFTDSSRFDVPTARILTAWPQEVLADYGVDDATCAVLLTHDPKIDDPALHHLLRSPARYIGALGGRKTQAARRERLARAGFDEAALARVHGPAGLAIGAATPAEIAVSILAEIVACIRDPGNG